MNYTVLNSKPAKAPSLATNEGLRDVVAAMPIVIFANALRAALHRPAPVRATLRTSESN